MSYSRIDLPIAREEREWEEDGIVGRRSVLPGGIRVITERVPGQHSISVGFWIGAGSRDEARGHEGSTHFLEHLLFKGTTSKSAAEISELGDFLGGTMNAATARQYTCYYGRVFSSDLPQLLELLVDMLANSVLEPDAMRTERTVILEELAASADNVVDVAQEATLPLVWGDHPLARPVGGTIEEVTNLEHSAMWDHYRENYNSRELVISAAGEVDHDELCAMVLALFASTSWDVTSDVDPAPRRYAADLGATPGGESRIFHPGRQSSVVVAMPGLKLTDDDHAAAIALDTIIGGGPSSRLFQEVREKRGLAYSTYSWQMNFTEGGLFALEAQCQPERAEAVAGLMGDVLDAIANDGVSQQEVLTAFNQRRAQLVFAAETNSYRRARLGNAEIYRGELLSSAESLREAREVTADQIQAIAQRLASGPRSLVIAGADKMQP